MRLFGSRVNDAARGGDIDLLVSVPQPLARPAALASRLGARLQMALGEQRIDIVLEAPNLQPLPIHRVAHEGGDRAVTDALNTAHERVGLLVGAARRLIDEARRRLDP